MSKQFDVVVFGATGFTGSLVARHFLQSPEESISWAIAGRNASKLDQVKQQLKEKLPAVDAAIIDAVPTLIADSGNEEQIVELVKKTKVVLTVVGPYKLYGEFLVKACAENGVHYCDLAGETLWIDEMITKYASAAAKSGAMIVHCCGFESVPSDLTTFMLVDSVRKTRNTVTSEVALAFTTLGGGVSGGTVASVINMFDTATPEEIQKSNDPFHLTDEKTRAEKLANGLVAKNGASLAIRKEEDLGLWSSLFIGSPVNQAVVHRSNYLQKHAYGDNFVYRERTASEGLFSQLFATASVIIGGGLLSMGWTRGILKKFVPQSGDGPSEEVVWGGGFVAKSVAYDEHGKLAARATTSGAGDPGYGMTSKVISECAICLAKGEIATKDLPGGFYTTATALGHSLVNRLEKKKIMTIEIEAVESN